ncbi:hypothetical protein JKP88DRAFT_251489 [Tribonema minus]|uniref:Uncharacterized protein n=1 Tax=Tribonema minus TaxID=303371 RepID=A0A836CN52_9STRA|nr:hypothetical protein JKP88DRAFT_251489 [Tribonema minus]
MPPYHPESMSNSGSSTHSRGGLAEELAEPVDVDAEAYRLGMRHNSESGSAILEIREWIDDAGAEIKSEIVDLGKILKASPAAAKKLYGDDSEAAIGEPTGSAAADVAAPQVGEPAAGAGAPEDSTHARRQPPLDADGEAALTARLEELERLEADQEAEESEYKAKGIVGKGWGKGFFGAGSQKTKKRPPQQQQQQPMPAPQQQPIEDAGAAAAIFRERITAAHTADSAADAPPPPPARAAHGGRERKSVSFDPVVREREIPARAPRPQSDAVNDMLRMFSEAVAETAEPLLEETELPPDVASPFGGMDAAALRAFRDRVYESGGGGVAGPTEGGARGGGGAGGGGRGR